MSKLIKCTSIIPGRPGLGLSCPERKYIDWFEVETWEQALAEAEALAKEVGLPTTALRVFVECDFETLKPLVPVQIQSLSDLG